MHSPGNCCSRSTLPLMERDSLTYTVIPPPLPLHWSLLKILYPGRGISPSAMPLLSHVSGKAIICKFGHCDTRTFNSSSFARILRIFWWINFKPHSLIALRSSMAILKLVQSTPLSPPESIFLTEPKKTLLACWKICTQTLEMVWLKAMRAICSSLIFPYSLVTVKALDTYWSWILKNISSDVYNTINWRDTTHFGSEDDYCTGCRNVSHCQQQQSYSGLSSPGRSNSTFWTKCT